MKIFAALFLVILFLSNSFAQSKNDLQKLYDTEKGGKWQIVFDVLSEIPQKN